MPVKQEATPEVSAAATRPDPPPAPARVSRTDLRTLPPQPADKTREFWAAIGFGAAQSDKLRAAVYFNLGLLQEKTGDLAAAQRSFMLSNELRPTRAAAAKLAASPVCVATIAASDAPAKSYATWRALSDAYPTEASDMPTSEATANRRACEREDCDTVPATAHEGYSGRAGLYGIVVAADGPTSAPGGRRTGASRDAG